MCGLDFPVYDSMYCYESHHFTTHLTVAIVKYIENEKKKQTTKWFRLNGQCLCALIAVNCIALVGRDLEI